jgi:hypothetical protein
MRTMSFYISLTTLLVVLTPDRHLSYHGSELKIIHQPQHWSCFKYLGNLRSLNLDISRILPSVWPEAITCSKIFSHCTQSLNNHSLHGSFDNQWDGGCAHH